MFALGYLGLGYGAHIEKYFAVPHLPVISRCFEDKRGIYKKMFFLCPAYLKKGDLGGHFFCICPGQGYFFSDSVQCVLFLTVFSVCCIPNRNISCQTGWECLSVWSVTYLRLGMPVCLERDLLAILRKVMTSSPPFAAGLC